MNPVTTDSPSIPRLRLLTRLKAMRPWQHRAGLWGHRDFMRLWAGQSISQFGSTITREALPYTAILVLEATPMEMGFLGAARAAPLLIFGLLVGVWVDRLRRRPIMIATDLARALLLLSIPLAYLWGVLRIEQLYLVVALLGILSVFFDAAYQAYLPALVEREHLVEGNSKLGMSDSVAEIAGPTIGGALVQLISGPFTILLDALSFLFSAVFLRRIRKSEPRVSRSEQREHVWHDLVAGLRTVFSHPMLRSLAVAAVIFNFFGWFYGAIYGLYAINVLHMSPTIVGITVACGGIGSLAGALLLRPVTRRFGLGKTIIGGLVISAAGSLLIWLAGGYLLIAVPLMIISQLVGDMAATIAMINQVSLRQTVTPDRLLGRVNASMNVLGEGVGTLGMLVGGLLGQVIGLRPTVGIIVCGMLFGCVWMLCSPLRHLE